MWLFDIEFGLIVGLSSVRDFSCPLTCLLFVCGAYLTIFVGVLISVIMLAIAWNMFDFCVLVWLCLEWVCLLMLLNSFGIVLILNCLLYFGCLCWVLYFCFFVVWFDDWLFISCLFLLLVLKLRYLLVVVWVCCVLVYCCTVTFVCLMVCYDSLVVVC